MSTLPEDMYCSEQICIPPSFPYLLRQYAKAAIRTQPTDILRWSTAYFRCLSLNLPPPVKPRLEYPIPRDYRGITPGWLKALYYQLQNNQTVTFKILWDRWMGACLHHNTLIQLLCLGGFDDPLAIRWLRFIAICAGTLTDDLTQTMIIICEVLTEEPEGGSAMIALETFLDLYHFLAKIDASHDQNLRNYYFRDNLLSLWREKIEKKESKEEIEDEVLQEDVRSVATKSSSAIMDTGEKLDEIERVVSCPSLPQDDQYSIEHLIIEQPEDVEEEEEERVTDLANMDPETFNFEEIEAVQEYKETEEDFSEMDKPEQEGEEADINLDEDEIQKQLDHHLEEPEDIYIKAEDLDSFSEENNFAQVAVEKEETVPAVLSLEAKEPDQIATEEKAAVEEVKPYESVDTITELPVRNLDLVFEDEETLKEDLERLRAMQQELAGETDEELEKFKCRLIEEMPLTESQEEGIKHFSIGEKLLLEPSSEENLKIATEVTAYSTESFHNAQAAQQYDDVFVEGIPGIGGTVPDKLIRAVVEYMTNCAKNQRGMVMPRNIRHYSCPPLEIVPT